MKGLRELTTEERLVIYQLFIGKVADELGFEKTMELLKESKTEILKAKAK